MNEEEQPLEIEGYEDCILQILNILKEELNNQEEALANYQTYDLETEAEWITEGWTEALTFAINQIEKVEDNFKKNKRRIR